MSDEQNFLSRWSRLKRRVSLERGTTVSKAVEPPPGAPAAAPEGRVENPAPVAEPAGKTGASAARRPDDEEPVDLTKLPPIDSLGKDSDYTVFLRKGVPEDLRTKALRRMWVTDPTISGPDLLEMNALDYTGLEGPRPLVISPTQAVAAAAKAVKQVLDDAARPASPPEGATQPAEPPDEPDEEKGPKSA